MASEKLNDYDLDGEWDFSEDFGSGLDDTPEPGARS